MRRKEQTPFSAKRFKETITASQGQVFLPIYWDDVQLEQAYRLDMVVNGQVIIELKAVSYVDTPHRRQLWSYMNLTHTAYGMLINFGSEHLYTECYHRYPQTGYIKKIMAEV